MVVCPYVFAQNNPAPISQSVSLEGRLIVTVADDFENQKAYTSYSIQTEDLSVYTIENLSALPLGITAGDYIRVDGNLVSGGAFYNPTILQPQITLIKKSENSNISLPAQNIRVAVILVNFRNDTRRPWSRQQIYDKYFSPTQNSVKTFYNENSYGKVSYSGNVFDNNGAYYMLDMDAPGCSQETEVLDRSIQAADGDIIFRDSSGQLFDMIVVAYPRKNCTDWAGMSGDRRNIPTNEGIINVGINWINGYAHHLLVVAHELGHNLGLPHASSWHCPSGRYSGGGCTRVEYGNRYDTMGANWGIGDSQTGHFNGVAKDFLGWFSNDNKRFITYDGVIVLAPLEAASRDVQVLLIGPYQVEYRKSIGFDSFLPASGLHIIRKGSFGASDLLDLHSVVEEFFLQVGEEFYDPGTDIYIRALAEHAYGMETQIQFTANPNIANLSVFQEDEWPSTISLGQSVDLSYYTHNNSSRDVDHAFREGLYIKFPNNPTWSIVQTREVSGLRAGGRQHDVFSWTAPTNICGAFRVKVVTDDQDEVLESSESDNATPNDNGHLVNVSCPGSDLTVTALNWPNRFNMGSNVSFGFTTTNQGTVDTGIFNERYTIDQQVISGRQIYNLGPGQSTTTGFVWNPTCGVHQVEVVTDVDSQIPETNELNNTTGIHRFWNNPNTVCGPESPISAHSSEEWAPSISGNKIVWQDNRSGNWDIYLFDLATKTERQLTSDPNDQIEPSIAGNIIAWTDFNGTNGITEIYMMDLTTNITRRITNNGFTDNYPSVSAERIVWVGRSNNTHQIYSYELASGQTRLITHSTQVVSRQWPRSWGNYIAWWEMSGNYASIFYYDFSTDRINWLTGGPVPSIGTPDIFDNKIVWSFNGVIFLHDLVLNQTQQISSILLSYSPKISGKNIVWSAENGYDRLIYWYDLTTQQTRRIVGGNGILGISPAISGNDVVWQDRRNSYDWNIYLYDITPIKIISPISGTSGSSNVAMVYEMNQGGILRFYDNDRLVYTTGNGRGKYQYTFTNLFLGWHTLKVKIENDANPGEASIRYYVNKRIETKPPVRKSINIGTRTR